MANEGTLALDTENANPIPTTATETAPELSIIVPTFNEAANVTELVKKLDECLGGVRWEVIFVDDNSPDGTADRVRDLARQDTRVRCLHRVGRRGLSSACVEGMLSSSAPYMAVMDGDLQHDETRLPEMLDLLRNSDVELVYGSRYTEGGGIGDWDESRALISRVATKLSRLILKSDISDPMSGFFMLRREVLGNTVDKLSQIGFKILVDILSSANPPLKTASVAYEFRTRSEGESKMDNHAAMDYLMLLFDKMFGHIVPARFVSFTIVGGTGIFIHLAVMYLLFQVGKLEFVAAQAIATLIAMTSNFTINNFLTYHDRKLTGWGWIKGLVTFNLACSIGAITNVGIASYIFAMETQWILASLAGIIVGAVWNYAVTSVYTWKSA